jgi:hypothetical protein
LYESAFRGNRVLNKSMECQREDGDDSTKST